MKKLWLILSVFVLCSCYVQGQNAAYYQFNTTVGDGTYVSLTDATELKASDDLVGAFDNYAYISATEVKQFSEIGAEEQLQGFEIGFDFTLGGQQFNRFLPTSEGYVVLGSNSFTAAAINGGSSCNFPAYAVGLRGDETTYRTTATVVAYKLTGEAGNRILSVEYRNQYYNATPAEGEGLNYTVRLYENGGKIELYFGSMVSGKASCWFGIGFTTGTDSDNKHFRQPDGTDWTNTSYATNGKAIAANANFPKGMTWTFTEPAPCTAPTDALVSAIDIIRPEGFHVVYDFDGITADGYVAFVSTEPLAEDVAPVNGTVYSYSENNTLGAAQFTNTGSIASNNAYTNVINTEPGNTYYVYTYLYNERCKGVRTYGARQTPAILLSAPALEMTYENDKISLWPKGTDTLVVLGTTVNGEKDMSNNIGNVGRFGIPTPAKKTGDTVWTSDKQFGGVILYKGLQPAAAFDYAETLKPFTNYHFAAFRRDAQGGYVTAFAQADTLTPPVIPFVDDFSTSVAFGAPQGYTGNDMFVVQRGGSVMATIALNTTGDAARAILETPEMVFPAEADARLIMEYNFVVPKSRFASSLTEDDYAGDNGVYFSVSENGGEWQQVYAITRSNPDLFASQAEYKKKFITLGNHSGKPCRVRIEVVGESLTGFYPAKVTINSISIVEKPACDAPLTVSVPSETVYGDSASVVWTPFDADNQQAGMAYRFENETTWRTLLEETSESTVNVGNLPNRAKIVVGVKTHCTGGAESVYTESEAFTTGYQMPFIEDFSTLGVYDRYGTKLYGLQEDWAISLSPLGTLMLRSGINALYSDITVFNKATQDEYDPQEPDGDKCVRFEANGNIWLVMPPVSLAEGHSAELSFDAALLQKDAADAATAVNADAKFIVYAAAMTEEDGMQTQTFAEENAILTLNQAELTQIGAQKQLKVAVPAALTGKVRFGFYYNAGEGDASNQFYLDNLGLAASCGQVVGVQTVSVGETAAVIGWRAYPGVNEYKVTVTETESEAAPQTLTVTEPKAELTGLEKATAYRVAVSYACSEEEDAPAAEITFTTGGVPCYDPTDLTATAVTKTSAVLSWTGEAETYNLEYKEASAETFASRVVTGTTYNLTNLAAGTDYVFRVQAVCNAAAGDMSEWTETEAFKTEDLTCFAPTDINVTPSFSQAEVVWKGDADQYQFAYRQGTDAATPWTTVFVADKKYVLTGLKAETIYQVRLRSICAAGDTSAYSQPVEFTTTAMAACPVPTQLRVEDTAFTSAKLAWDGDEQHEGYLFRYRETTATAWDSVKDLTVTTYTLDKLKANTAYIWSVNAACSENRVSGWATANEFKTPEEVANETVLRAGFELYATKGHINILNRNDLYVDVVDVYTVDGRQMAHYTVHTAEHVLLPVSLGGVPVMVVLQTEAGRVTYKILLP